MKLRAVFTSRSRSFALPVTNAPKEPIDLPRVPITMSTSPSTPVKARVATMTAAIGAIWKLYPGEFAWGQPPYKYEKTKLPIDILAGDYQFLDSVRIAIEGHPVH